MKTENEPTIGAMDFASQLLPAEFFKSIYYLLFQPSFLIQKLKEETKFPWFPMVQLFVIVAGFTAVAEFFDGPGTQMPAANGIYRVHLKRLAESESLPKDPTKYAFVQILGIVVDNFPELRRSVEEKDPLILRISTEPASLENDIKRSLSLPGFSTLQFLLERDTSVRTVDQLIELIGKDRQEWRADLLEAKLQFHDQTDVARILESLTVLLAAGIIAGMLKLIFFRRQKFAFFFGVSCYFLGIQLVILWAIIWIAFYASWTSLFGFTLAACCSTVVPLFWFLFVVPKALETHWIKFLLGIVISLAVSQTICTFLFNLLVFQIGL